MSEPSPGQASAEGGHGQRPKPGPLLVLVVVAAVCLVCSSFVLPWIRWGFPEQGIGDAVSLWDLVSKGDESQFGATWMLPVAAGMAAAVAGSLFEMFSRPVSRAPRWLALAGFATVAGSSCIGLVVGVSGSGSATAVALPESISSTLDIGFWVALGIAVAGAVASLVHVGEPPNPAREPEPFAPSPWGPPPGILPAGYYPPGTDWSEYVSRGQVPPGFVPPSYKPAVYPTPGFVTRAYTLPGNLSGLGPPFDQMPGDLPIDSSGTAGDTAGAPTLGHLAVVEAGGLKILTVEPGQRLLVGRDSEAEIRVSDPKVGQRHATIERRGDGWAVQDIDAVKSTRLIDAWGTNRQVRGETTVSSGQLVVGDVLITLYANRP